MVVKSTLLLDVALLVSTYLYFLEGKGVVPVYHKLFKTMLLTSHSLHKNFKESQPSDFVFSIMSLSHSLGNFSQLTRYVHIFSLTPTKILGLICYLLVVYMLFSRLIQKPFFVPTILYIWNTTIKENRKHLPKSSERERDEIASRLKKKQPCNFLSALQNKSRFQFQATRSSFISKRVLL